jgi:two-component sensor histidine kinase
VSAAAAVDATAGLALALAGCWIATRRPAIGWWLLAAAAAWFVGGWIPSLALAHRVPLIVALVLAATSEWSSAARAALVGLVGCALLSAVWPNAYVLLALGCALVVFAARRDRSVRAPRSADVTTIIAGGVVIVVAAVRLAGDATSQLAVIYSIGIALVAISMVVVGIDHAHRLVLDLVSSPHGRTLDDRLRIAYGDPSLRLLYNPSTPITATDGTVTTLYREGRSVGVVVHAKHVRFERRVVDGLGALVALSNDALELRRQASAALVAIEQAGRDAATAREREAILLARQVDDGPQSALARAAVRVRHLPVADHILVAQRELAAVAAGLAPRHVCDGGLRAALSALAVDAPVPVEVTVENDVPFDDEQTHAVLSICAEALANAIKHAKAGVIRIDVVVRPELVLVEVRDDGVGGADANGFGIRGMFDRSATIGGSLRISDRAVGGTRVSLSVPRPEVVA